LIIDFHNHFYPGAYIEELKREKGYASVSVDPQGRLLIHYTGDYNVVVGPHIDLEHRLRDMDRTGIDMQVLTLTTPGVEREAPERGVKLARLTNDGFAEIIDDHPDRFTALATLPLQDSEAAVEELERAVTELGLRGAMLLSNVNGKPLDAKEFGPVLEKAVKLDVPLYIHPRSPTACLQRGLEEAFPAQAGGQPRGRSLPVPPGPNRDGVQRVHRVQGPHPGAAQHLPEEGLDGQHNIRQRRADVGPVFQRR
jgi:predicted TIM-barrel fold metal-dependent hydrolase